LGVTIHGTIPGVAVDLLSRPSLATTAAWTEEQQLVGTEGQDWTFTWVSMTARSNLFLWAISWVDNDGGGLPDWWQLKYFGHTGVDAYSDPDGDGWTTIEEFYNGTNPSIFNTPRAPSGFRAVPGTNGAAA